MGEGRASQKYHKEMQWALAAIRFCGPALCSRSWAQYRRPVLNKFLYTFFLSLVFRLPKKNRPEKVGQKKPTKKRPKSWPKNYQKVDQKVNQKVDQKTTKKSTKKSTCLFKSDVFPWVFDQNGHFFRSVYNFIFRQKMVPFQKCIQIYFSSKICPFFDKKCFFFAEVCTILFFAKNWSFFSQKCEQIYFWPKNCHFSSSGLFFCSFLVVFF